MRWTNRHGWRWHAFRATAMVTTIALMGSALPVLAADTPPTSNIDLLAIMTHEIVEELYTKFGPELGGRGVTLRPFASGDDYTFVGNVFANVLTSRGVKTIVPPPTTRALPAGTNPNTIDPKTGATIATPPTATADSLAVAPGTPLVGAASDVVLTYQNVAFGVAYPDVYRSHLIGGKRVKRRADVRVHATATDGRTGEVLWVGEATRERNDEFDMDDAASVEQGVYPFARPVLPGGGWGRYAEPVFVTGIIVGLIYLFFSNQSDN